MTFACIICFCFLIYIFYPKLGSRVLSTSAYPDVNYSWKWQPLSKVPVTISAKKPGSPGLVSGVMFGAVATSDCNGISF